MTCTYRPRVAIELRGAAALRRDLRAGLLPRAAALSAIRDHLRHARLCRLYLPRLTA